MTQYLTRVPFSLGTECVKAAYGIVKKHGGGAWTELGIDGSGQSELRICAPSRWPPDDRRGLELAVRECCDKHAGAAEQGDFEFKQMNFGMPGPITFYVDYCGQMIGTIDTYGRAGRKPRLSFVRGRAAGADKNAVMKAFMPWYREHERQYDLRLRLANGLAP